jgi:hypothetical protein
MNLLRALLFTGVVMVFVSAPDLAPSQEKQPPSSSGHMMSTEKISMDDMMKDCMQHHRAGMKSIDQMSKMMEGAKQSNDPGKMRTAIDQAQKQLAEMKEHMSKCGEMMSMMEKMQGMGGMMKGKSK